MTGTRRRAANIGILRTTEANALSPGAEEPTRDQILAMLQQLYDEGYRGILTYDISGALSCIPCLARCVGFELVGAGVFNINDDDGKYVNLLKKYNAVTRIRTWVITATT